jgi:hypothetical protein
MRLNKRRCREGKVPKDTPCLIQVSKKAKRVIEFVVPCELVHPVMEHTPTLDAVLVCGGRGSTRSCGSCFSLVSSLLIFAYGAGCR